MYMYMYIHIHTYTYIYTYIHARYIIVLNPSLMFIYTELWGFKTGPVPADGYPCHERPLISAMDGKICAKSRGEQMLPLAPPSGRPCVCQSVSLSFCHNHFLVCSSISPAHPPPSSLSASVSLCLFVSVFLSLSVSILFFYLSPTRVHLLLFLFL